MSEPAAERPALHLRVGVDLVDVRRIADSMETFGDRFLERLFTPGELAYATSAPAQTAQRLAARFAAKEATIKALSLVDRGVDWRHIEVTRDAAGGPALALHGTVAQAASALCVAQLSVSLSHEGDQAIAVVVAQARERAQ